MHFYTGVLISRDDSILIFPMITGSPMAKPQSERDLKGAVIPVKEWASRASGFPFRIGIFFVAVGSLCNLWVLTRLFSSDGALEFETRAVIWFFDLALIGIGLFLVWYSRFGSSIEALRYCQARYPRGTALVIGILLSAILLVCAEVFFFALNQAKTDHSRVEDFGVQFVRKEWLGFENHPSARFVHRLRLGDREIFNVTYSTDSLARRITPANNSGAKNRFGLFFGCSYTFGFGVADDATLPSQVGQLAPVYKPYNYGVIGYGAQHVMLKLQDPKLRNEIEEKEGVLVYLFIDDHIQRVTGIVNHHGREMPYYTLDARGELQRNGDMVSGRPGRSLWFWLLRQSQMAAFFQVGMDSSIGVEDIRLTTKMIEEARNSFCRTFRSSRFYVLLYPDSGSRFRNSIKKHLERAHVEYLDYTELFDPNADGLRIEADNHPTSKALRLVAEQLVRDLKLADS